MTNSRYKLLKELGKGAYGIVFKAQCNFTGKRVAIKFIDLSNVNEAYLRVICREVKINVFLSSLKSNIFTPRLVDIYFPADTVEDDPKSVRGIYLVFEYYRQTLQKILCSPEYPLMKK